MSVKAKFVCTAAEKQITTGQTSVTMRAVTSGSDENKDWSLFTPSGLLQMEITNPAAADQFEIGKEYYLTIDAAE